MTGGPAADRLVTVAVVGPESTGKTTLAGRLAAAYGAERSPEAARRYAADRAAAAVRAPLTAGDVAPIARLQIALEDAAERRARASGASLVVRDTDLVSTVVYARHHYGACPAWVERAAQERRAGLYLLCDVDVPWQPEPGQRDAAGADPSAREALRDAFVAALGEFGCRYAWVRGTWGEREGAAAGAVAALRTAAAR